MIDISIEDSLNTDLVGKFKWLNNRPLFASISGGKDSVAVGLYLKENGIKFIPIFLDTGWEHPIVHTYIHDTLEPVFGKFLIIRNEKYFDHEKSGKGWKGGMEQLIYKKKMFPSGRVKFCTSELKVIPVMNFYAEIRREHRKKPVNIVGIRAQESKNRSLMTSIEAKDEACTWRPILDWTEKEVIEMHHKHHMSPNPLYILGYNRVGCYPCIYSNKKQIRLLAGTDLKRIEHIRELENRVNDELREADKRKATFFKSKVKGIESMGIDDVVRWSNRAGTVDDLQEIGDEGCMRWGLCEPVGMQMPFAFFE